MRPTIIERGLFDAPVIDHVPNTADEADVKLVTSLLMGKRLRKEDNKRPTVDLIVKDVQHWQDLFVCSSSPLPDGYPSITVPVSVIPTLLDCGSAKRDYILFEVNHIETYTLSDPE